MKPMVVEAVKKLHEFFRKKEMTLSVAESCTGGLVSHYITNLPGASSFFIAGIIAYSSEIKKNILNVAPEIFSRYGAVSKETAVEMAEKVRLLSRTDYGISTTGNLGPDVLEGKEKGLVYIAVSREGRTVWRELKLKGDRNENKEEAALEVLRLLNELIDLK